MLGSISRSRYHLFCWRLVDWENCRNGRHLRAAVAEICLPIVLVVGNDARKISCWRRVAHVV